jgi:hypothetical protein
MRHNLTIINATGNACSAIVVDTIEECSETGYFIPNLKDDELIRYGMF